MKLTVGQTLYSLRDDKLGCKFAALEATLEMLGKRIGHLEAQVESKTPSLKIKATDLEALPSQMGHLEQRLNQLETALQTPRSKDAPITAGIPGPLAGVSPPPPPLELVPAQLERFAVSTVQCQMHWPSSP